MKDEGGWRVDRSFWSGTLRNGPPITSLIGDDARISLINSSFPLALPSVFLTVVKSRINARIRRNSNGIFILCTDDIFVEVGFVRIISAGTRKCVRPRGSGRTESLRTPGATP